MKKIVQNLLAVFLLAVLLVPATAFGTDGTVTECSSCKSTKISKVRASWYNGKHMCIYKCAVCQKVTYGSYVACDVTMPTKCTETATCPTCGHKYTGTTHNMPDEVSWVWSNADGKGFASVSGAAACMDCRQEFTTKANSIGYKVTTKRTCQLNEKVTYTISGVMLGGRSYSPATTVEITGTATGSHSPSRDKGKPATCTEDGLTEGSHCSVCNTVLVKQEVIPATGHTEVTDAAVAATCTKPGKTEGKHCSVCNAVLVKQEAVPVKDHTVVTDAAVAATCTKTGLTAGSHCSVCNKVLTEQEVVPVKEHTVVVDAAVEPTCTAAGWSGGGQPL